MNKQLIIIRGVMGSGKSTIANAILIGMEPLRAEGPLLNPQWFHYEADMFFTDLVTGEYKWDGSKIGQAHHWCEHMVDEAMKKGRNVIVSNTFIKKADYKIYEEMATQYGYTTQIIICQGQFQNIHGVPEDKVRQKRQAFES